MPPETDHPPGPEQFERWRDSLTSLAMPVDVRSDFIAQFTGSIHASTIGRVTTVHTRNRTVSTHRVPSLIRRSDPEIHFLLLNLSRGQRVSVNRAETVLHHGDMVLLHSSRVFEAGPLDDLAQQSGGLALWEAGALEIPRAGLDRLIGQRLAGDDPVGGLVSRYLHKLGAVGASLGAADALRLSTVTLDLVSMMLARSLGMVGKLSSDRLGRERFARIQSFISSRLGDPALTPATIAAAHHVSPRTLHRLFEANAETTVARWIRDRRLRGLRADLLDPSLAERPIAVLASRWGFVDLAHVTRVFKAAFGMSPAAYRRHRSSES